MKIIILRAVVQSWNFADFDLYIGGETGKLINVGFPQCKTIIMPLLFQSSVPLFPCLLFSALPSLCEATFSLLRGLLLTSSPSLFTLNFKSAFSLLRRFCGKPSWTRIWSHLLCLCVLCMGNCSWFTDSTTLFHRRWINTKAFLQGYPTRI